MRERRYGTCPLCEATCGVAIDVDGGRVVSVRGDEADPFSRGYICPKAAALVDVHHDPDRLRRPVLREGETFREIGWDEAFDFAARALRSVRARHGRDALAVYQGNPTTHSLGMMTVGQLFLRRLGTRNLYSTTSVDQLPHMLAALQVFGNQFLLPVPDIDRTDYFLCIGANPAVSNGSIMTAPDVKRRLRAIRARGGEVVVVDPRRTETADLASRHLFVRPGTDALFLLALVHTLFDEDLVRTGRLSSHLHGVQVVRGLSDGFPPEQVASATGVAAADIRRVARELASHARAVCYGRVGICTQEFGGLAAWLVLVVNVLSGHLDEVGGAMFTTPAVDALRVAPLFGWNGGFDRWHSRVSSHPEFGGELPAAALAEEIDTPGKGQVQALITAAANPVLSAPNGPRLERALPRLEFMVSIDPYLNETTRHAHLILPPASPLMSSHYDLVFNTLAVRNVAKYSPPAIPRPEDQRTDWEICAELMVRVGVGEGRVRSPVRRALAGALNRLGPEAMVDVGLRTGPYRRRVSLRSLRTTPHGVDFGPLRPRLPRLLPRPRIQLAPAVYQADVPRLRQRALAWESEDGLVIIGRRQLRSDNSWLHNSARLVAGKPRCTLLMHPEDAAGRGLADGDLARVDSRVGQIEVPVEITDRIMPGVVSLPHGWGHDRPGVWMEIARAHAGASLNDITDEQRIDRLSGTSALSGLRVGVSPATGNRLGVPETQ